MRRVWLALAWAALGGALGYGFGRSVNWNHREVLTYTIAGASANGISALGLRSWRPKFDYIATWTWLIGCLAGGFAITYQLIGLRGWSGFGVGSGLAVVIAYVSYYGPLICCDLMEAGFLSPLRWLIGAVNYRVGEGSFRSTEPEAGQAVLTP